MKRLRELTAVLVTVGIVIAVLVGCTEVNHNISQEANNFNVSRRLEVINARTDKPLFELIGNFALTNNAENELVVMVELEDGTYKKHYIYLNDYTMYVVEDLSGSDVSPFQYEIHVLPEQFKVFSLQSVD
ncbi:MAG: hypothetical protein LUD77_02410 [Clostridiales bacterium]|nr:hypothetical protein [Clostridiales bacterium]